MFSHQELLARGKVDECLALCCTTIFDPKAMHHIVIKDQEIFQEAMWFSSLVS